MSASTMEPNLTIIQDLRSSNALLKDDLQDAHRTIDQIRQHVLNARDEHNSSEAAYREDLEKARHERGGFCREAADMEMEAERLRKKVAGKDHELNTVRHEMERLSAISTADKQQLAKMNHPRSEADDLRRQVEEHCLKTDGLTAENQRIQTEIKLVRTQHQMSVAEIESSRAERSRLTDELDNLKGKYAAETVQVTDLWAKNVQGQAQLQALRAENTDLALRWQRPKTFEDASVQHTTSILESEGFDSSSDDESHAALKNASSSYQTRHCKVVVPKIEFDVPARKRISQTDIDDKEIKRRKLASSSVLRLPGTVSQDSKGKQKASTISRVRLILNWGQNLHSVSAVASSSAANQLARCASPTIQRFRDMFDVREIPISLESRVSSFDPVEVSRVFSSPSHVYAPFVSRKFLAKHYGLSPQSLIGKIKSERNIPNSQLRQVVFPQRVQNPGLPAYPGAAGTIIANRLELLDDPHRSLFLRAKDEALWVYAGYYLIEKNEKPLSPVEFATLPPKTRAEWGKAILQPQTWVCYTHMRARIYLRKRQAQITDSAVLAEVKSSEKSVTVQDILNALDSGDETLNVLTLRPLGYDADFQENLMSRYPAWSKTTPSHARDGGGMPMEVPTHYPPAPQAQIHNGGEASDSESNDPNSQDDFVPSDPEAGGFSGPRRSRRSQCAVRYP